MGYLDTRLNIKIRPETKEIFETAKKELGFKSYNQVVKFLYDSYKNNEVKK